MIQVQFVDTEGGSWPLEHDWPTPPRVGDHVRLPRDGEDTTHEVVRVSWYDSSGAEVLVRPSSTQDEARAAMNQKIKAWQELIDRQRAKHPEPDFATRLQISSMEAQVQQLKAERAAMEGDAQTQNPTPDNL